MSSGATHDRVTWFCLPWIGGLAYWGMKDIYLAGLLAGGFLMGGLMFGPDLDIQSVQINRWGVLRWIWKPYQALLGHRSWLSHGPLIGTTLRLLYFCGMVSILGSVSLLCLSSIWNFSWDIGAALPWLSRWVKLHAQELLITIAGLELGALSHICMDGLSSAWKKKPRRKRSRHKSRFF
jgi:uncharacterized metal-binding protein